MSHQSNPYETPFKEGEVLLVFFQDEPAFFIRVENILADKKKGWWHTQFITLTLPINEMSWILSDDHIRGSEFKMQNNPVRLKRITGTHLDTMQPPEGNTEKKIFTEPKSANIISMFDDEV